MDGIKFCHLGDLGHDLDEETVQKIGEVDVLFIPIGGTFTVDDKQAWDVIKKIQPRIVIPMHYKIGGLSLPIAGIDAFLEQNPYKLLHVGNEIDIEKEDLPSEPEVWTFTL
jgi:L-ascorbate metabolism protein UlaG (beta-lactamase superfamily)